MLSFQSQVQGEGLPASEDGLSAQTRRTWGGGWRNERGGWGKALATVVNELVLSVDFALPKVIFLTILFIKTWSLTRFYFYCFLPHKENNVLKSLKMKVKCTTLDSQKCESVFLLRVRRERTVLLFILFSKNSGTILLPESGESLFQVRVWKNHLLYSLLFGEIGASPLFRYVCSCMHMCVQVWISYGLWKSAREHERWYKFSGGERPPR